MDTGQGPWGQGDESTPLDEAVTATLPGHHEEGLLENRQGKWGEADNLGVSGNDKFGLQDGYRDGMGKEKFLMLDSLPFGFEGHEAFHVVSLQHKFCL